MHTLHRLDHAVLAATRADRMILLMRRHRVGTVLTVGVLVLMIFAVAQLGEVAPQLLPASWILSVLAVIAGILLALAIVDDYNATGLRGGWYGLLFLVTGGLVALVWALDRRLPSPPDEEASAPSRSGASAR